MSFCCEIIEFCVCTYLNLCMYISKPSKRGMHVRHVGLGIHVEMYMYSCINSSNTNKVAICRPIPLLKEL